MQALVVAHGAVLVGHGHDLHAGRLEQLDRAGADLAEALDRRRRPRRLDAEVLERGERHVDHARRGGGGAAQRAAERDGLAGDHAERGVADVHRVGVHHPGHGLLVRAHVRGGDVHLGADDRLDLGGVAAGDALELGLRVLARVDGHPALGAAVGHVQQGALPGHPHGQCADLVQVHVQAEAHAALGRAAGEVVLHAVAAEHLGGAVVAAQGDGDGHLAAGGGEHLVQALVVAERLHGGGELGQGVVERGGRGRHGLVLGGDPRH